MRKYVIWDILQLQEMMHMLSLSTIREAVKRIAPQYPIERVMLFGSYADGSATSESDIDLLVELSLIHISEPTRPY